LSYVGRFIQCLQKDHERYIQECHEGDKGACKSISRSLKPSIMVLTNIAFSHLAQFPNKESFVAEFADVTAGMPDDGIVVYNYDDDNLRSINWTRKTVTVSMERPDADYTAKNIREYYNRT